LWCSLRPAICCAAAAQRWPPDPAEPLPTALKLMHRLCSAQGLPGSGIRNTAISQTYRGHCNGILFSCTYFMGRRASTQDYNREKGKCSGQLSLRLAPLLMCKGAERRVCNVLTCDNDPCFACTARSIRRASACRRTTANTVGTATDEFTFFVNTSDDVVPFSCIDKML